MRRSGGCLARSRRSSVLLSTSQGQAPGRLRCKVGWVGSAKFFLDVAVCVAWCHVATIKTCTADQTCRYSSRPVLESNEDHGNRPGSRDFGHFDGQIDHIGSQHFKSILSCASHLRCAGQAQSGVIRAGSRGAALAAVARFYLFRVRVLFLGVSTRKKTEESRPGRGLITTTL